VSDGSLHDYPPFEVGLNMLANMDRVIDEGRFFPFYGIDLVFVVGVAHVFQVHRSIFLERYLRYQFWAED
jgi:hypothetical protein